MTRQDLNDWKGKTRLTTSADSEGLAGAMKGLSGKYSFSKHFMQSCLQYKDNNLRLREFLYLARLEGF